MALTLVEAAKLTQDVMLAGVIETIVKESQILERLPFDDLNGTALEYNRELTMPAVDFFNVGDTWTEATPTYTPVTVALKIMGGDADVDNFLQTTYANPNDQAAQVIASRAKATAHRFSESFVVGDTAVQTKGFDGVRKLIPVAQQVSMGTNGGPLTLAKMDEFIDLVRPGLPDVLLMSKRTRRKLSDLRRTSGNLLETDRNDFGRRAIFYDGIEILVDDFVPDNEVQGSSGAVCSSIYALKFGQGVGVAGLQGGGGIQVEDVGTLETKDAMRHRIKWYSTIALYSELGTARLLGITAA